MLRALFFEYPEDRTSWTVEDQYLFGTDLLVAPLLEEARRSRTRASRRARAGSTGTR